MQTIWLTNSGQPMSQRTGFLGGVDPYQPRLSAAWLAFLTIPAAKRGSNGNFVANAPRGCGHRG